MATPTSARRPSRGQRNLVRGTWGPQRTRATEGTASPRICPGQRRHHVTPAPPQNWAPPDGTIFCTPPGGGQATNGPRPKRRMTPSTAHHRIRPAMCTRASCEQGTPRGAGRRRRWRQRRPRNPRAAPAAAPAHMPTRRTAQPVQRTRGQPAHHPYSPTQPWHRADNPHSPHTARTGGPASL